jgi:hypothetical protein
MKQLLVTGNAISRKEQKSIFGGLLDPNGTGNDCGGSSEGTCGVNVYYNGILQSKSRGCKKSEAQEVAALWNNQSGYTAYWCCASCS